MVSLQGRLWTAVLVGLVGVWTALSPATSPAQMRTRARAFAGIDDAGNATTVEAALRLMTEQAAVVFVGTVTEVQRMAGDGVGLGQVGGVVEIRFAVDQAVRGVATGQVYTLREWGGLWSASDHRYTVGSRVLMLLHAPSATGLSSPVGGLDGVIPVRGGSLRVGDATATEAAATQMVDLRWLQAKLARAVEYRSATRPVLAGARAIPSDAAAASIAATVSGGGAAETAAGAERSVASAQASVQTVVSMMSGWVAGEVSDAR